MHELSTGRSRTTRGRRLAPSHSLAFLVLIGLLSACQVTIGASSPMASGGLQGGPAPAPTAVASPVIIPTVLFEPVEPDEEQGPPRLGEPPLVELPTAPMAAPATAQTSTSVPTRAVPTPTPVPTLTPAQSPPVRIEIPSIGVDAPVLEAGWKVVEEDGLSQSVWQVPENAAGWHINSALPHQGSNVVLSGHHNIGGEVFRNLVDVAPGDEIRLEADGRTYVYRVMERFIVPERDAPEAQRRQNAGWIMPTRVERLTLVTCWPYEDNSHRVIVVAEPVVG